jgi:hypothetical protein
VLGQVDLIGDGRRRPADETGAVHDTGELADIVTDQADAALSLCTKVAQIAMNALPLDEIEHRPAFVDQEHVRRIREPTRQREQLLLTAAELVRIAIGQMAQSQGVQRLRGLAATAAGAAPRRRDQAAPRCPRR